MDVPTSDSPDSKLKQVFEQKLSEYEKKHEGSKRKPWTRERIQKVINQLKQAKTNMESKSRRAPMEYYWMSKYEILDTNDEEHIIYKRNKAGDPNIRIIPREEYFDILTEIHNACGHGGRDKMLSSLNTHYYITKKAVEIFVSLCPTCVIKRSKKETPTTPTPKKQHSEELFNAGKIDILDLNNCPDGDYKWILMYQDCSTKFLSLRPLQTNQTNEVALELMKIFMTFSPPYMLYYTNGREFTAELIRKLTLMWPACKIINGSLKSPKTQDNFKESENVTNMLRIWMAEKKSTQWSIGCYFVQYQMNTSLNDVIRKSPYEALFGSKPKSGFSSSVFSPLVCLNTKSKEAQFSDSMSKQNCIEQQCSETVNQNSDKQKFSDSMLNQKNSHEIQCGSNMMNEIMIPDIKVEIDKWESEDHDVIIPDKKSQSIKKVYEKFQTVYIREGTVCKTEDDMESQRIKDCRGIKREAETTEDDMKKKLAPLPARDNIV